MSGIQKVISHLIVDFKVGDVCGINHTAVLWSKEWHVKFVWVHKDGILIRLTFS